MYLYLRSYYLSLSPILLSIFISNYLPFYQTIYILSINFPAFYQTIYLSIISFFLTLQLSIFCANLPLNFVSLKPKLLYLSIQQSMCVYFSSIIYVIIYLSLLLVFSAKLSTSILTFIRIALNK